MSETNNPEDVTNRDIEVALRLSRKHIYGGMEPYAPAISSFARMLAEHRAECCAEFRQQLLRRARELEGSGHAPAGATIRSALEWMEKSHG